MENNLFARRMQALSSMIGNTPIENPSLQDIEKALKEIFRDHDPKISNLYLAVHRMILETLPEVKFSMDLSDGQMGYGAKQFGYNGWGMVALSPHKKWVNLHFMKGAELSQAEKSNVLEGKGKQLRHLKFSSLEEVEEKEKQLSSLLYKASKLNE